ncbi:MAG: thioredoxin family protein, partial [Kiritimatiellaeota bacterium]|nr:thioredoxin family protein [Kiritimatiellota bacterium]
MKAKVSVGAIVASVALSGVAAIVEPSIRPRWSGAEVGEWTMDYNAAFAAAATNEASRGVVLYFTGLWWCPYCQALETKVLIQQGWQDYVQENQFYLVAIDNLSRTGGNWCWLWDTDYLDEAGLTLQEANQELLDRYLLQTQYATPDATHNTAFDYDQIGYPTMLIFRPGNSAYPMGRTSFPDFSTTSYTVITATANVLQQFDQILATDPEDGKDNYWQGATQLDVSACEDNVTAFGSRTLSPRDTADWYAFESIPNRKWTFAITPGGRGETNNITAAIFVNPAGSAVLSQSFVPSGGTGLTYTTPSAGTYYLRMTRPSGSASVVQGYHLAYSYSEPWKTTVSETCTGPGAMMFTPQLEGGAEMTLLVNGGVVTDDFTDGVACWIAVGPGKHTVVWQTEGFGGASGSVGGVAFVALSQAAPLSPLDKSIVAADAREGFFTWGGDSLPPALSPSYTIYAGP